MDPHFHVTDAALAGRIRHSSALWPAVGDYVLGEPQPGGWTLITEVLPRQSVLARKDPGGQSQILAANVDTLFIVTSANQDLNLNQLERYAALATAGGVRPVIVLNKIELASDPHALLDEIAARFPTLDIFGTSANEGWNLDALEQYAQPNCTVAFVGSSGVGKSTLTNALIGHAVAETSGIRSGDDRGRHTTTHRELHRTPNQAFVIDTPGLRTVGLTDETDVESLFPDIEELTRRCRFSDCAHDTEPGCAVTAALESGELLPERWENFVKLGKELAYERRKGSKALQSEEKKHWAKIAMAIRKRMR